jgi:protein-tyrosine phosphatase
MNHDLFWIPGPWQGHLAVIARPRGGDWLESEVGGWRRAGIDVVVSLLEGQEAAQFELGQERKIAESKGIQFISFPIPDRGLPPSTRDALLLLSNLSAALADGKNVAVHCRQGIGRSGLLAAGLLVTSGMDAAKAIREVSAARGQNIPETPAQLQWIRQLPTESLVPAS